MNENEQRNYPDSKVYHDGSHYIAIPQGSYPSCKCCKRRHTAIPTPEQLDRKERFETAYKESKKIPYKQRDKFLNEQLTDTHNPFSFMPSRGAYNAAMVIISSLSRLSAIPAPWRMKSRFIVETEA